MNVYLDNNATTCVAPEVVEAMRPFWTDRYGNPSSIHSFGGKIRAPIARAREQVAALFGASPSESLKFSALPASFQASSSSTPSIFGGTLA